jgi:YihY family inner membrane protein
LAETGNEEAIANRHVVTLDRFQQRHLPTAFVYGVIKKYGDDRGGLLAALVAYYGFLSLFPLLVILFTVVAYILPLFPEAEHRLVDSVLTQFPVIGPQLRDNVHPLEGNPVSLVLGVLVLLWGALGLADVLQFVMNQIWNIPERRRAGFFPRLARSLLLYALLAPGLAATTLISSLGTVLHWGSAGSLLASLPGLAANTGLFFVVFRVLTPAQVGWKQLIPGVIVSGAGWQLMQTIGVNLLVNQLRHASHVYGIFGLTIGLIGFLYVAAQLVVYSAEINVVSAQRLWPRGLLPTARTPADRRQLASLVNRAERVLDEEVEVKS